MADIAFLLIIFFMVTAVFSATKGLELKLPQDDRSRDHDTESAVFVHVREDRVVVDCEEMRPSDLLAYLEPKLIRNPDKPVILYTDPGAKYQRMIEVYDVLAGTRTRASEWPFVVTNISIPTKTDLEEYVAMFGANPFESWCNE